MRIPIIIQANPITNRISPVVFLPDGVWNFVGDYTDECKIDLIDSHDTYTPLQKDRKYTGGRSISLDVSKSLKKSLTISAERCQSQ